jgi:hypothetical protein
VRTYQIAVPAQHRVGPHEQPQPAQHRLGQWGEQGREEGPVLWGERDPRRAELSSQDRELVPQRQDLGVFLTILIGSGRSAAKARVTIR